MDRGTTDTSAEIEEEPKRRHWFADVFIRLFKEKPLGAAGAVVTIILVVVAIFADVIAPYGYNETKVAGFLAPPSADHLLGGDHLGRDIFSRIVYGARISVIIAIVSSTIAIINTTIIGVLSGYIGGKFDMIVQRFVDAFMCFPGLIILILIMSFVGPGVLQVILVIGMVFGIAGSRTIRSAVIAIKENVYVQAAQAIGCSTPRVLFRHILPNVMAPIIVLFTTRLPGVVLIEASLSYLGYGIPPPIPSWGSMLSQEGRTFMFMSPGMAIYPGLALSIVVFGVNMFGDALRDLLDPRLRGGIGRYGGGRSSP